MASLRSLAAGAAAIILLGTACAPDEGGVRWGPHDGRDLPPTDLDRLAVGDPAPDFTLPAFDGDTVTLSDYRGEKLVVLQFYRGHW